MTDSEWMQVKSYGRDVSGRDFVMPPSPWWQNFDAGMLQRRFPYEAGLRARLLIGLGWLFDMAVLISLSIPFLLIPVWLLLLRLGARVGIGRHYRELVVNEPRHAPFYRSLAEGKSTEELFPPPQTDVPIVESNQRPLSFDADGTCVDLSFESPFLTLNPDVREAYAHYRRNRICHARHWKHGDGPRPTVVIVHGFVISQYWANSLLFDARRLYREGNDVLFYLQPFHGKRRVWLPGHINGIFFFIGSTLFNEAVAHSVHDFRVLMNHLEASGCREIGATGVSLGGFVTSLLSTIEPRLAFAAPRLPMVNMADAIARWPGLGFYLRHQHRFGGQRIDDLRRTVAFSCPLTHAQKLPRERLMISGAIGDALVSAQMIQLLSHHWGGVPVRWHRHGHLSFRPDTNGDELLEFLHSIGFGQCELASNGGGSKRAAMPVTLSG